MLYVGALLLILPGTPIRGQGLPKGLLLSHTPRELLLLLGKVSHLTQQAPQCHTRDFLLGRSGIHITFTASCISKSEVDTKCKVTGAVVEENIACLGQSQLEQALTIRGSRIEGA